MNPRAARPTLRTARGLAAVVAVATLLACSHRAPTVVAQRTDGPSPSAPLGDARAINPRLLRRFAVLPHAVAAGVTATPAQVELGRVLWYDPRLSQDRDISCNSCHALDAYGVENEPTSTGHRGAHGRRNAPTVYNASEHFALFWDGRARTVEEQAGVPIQSATEMALAPDELSRRLRAMPGYVALFRAAFPADVAPVSFANATRAIGAFERGLRTHSRWDDYLAGDHAALSAEEVRGLRVFLDVGCVGCHTGPQVGASMFQLVGAVEPWPRRDDLGRFELTHVATDAMVFKVPTLRNIARTAPYFHDGSCARLADAVRLMGRHQLGVELEDGEVDALVAFFGALTGALPTAYIARPALPTDATAIAALDATHTARGALR